MTMDPMEEIKQMFFVECEELLEALQDGLEVLRGTPEDGNTVDTVFRAVHSIKGGAAAFGLDDLVGFAHEFETVLDGLRSGTLSVTDNVLTILQKSADTLNDMVACGKSGTPTDDARIAELVSELIALVSGPESSESASPAPEAEPEIDDSVSPSPVAEPVLSEKVTTTATSQGSNLYRIAFKPQPDLFERGNEPGLVIRELSELGDVVVTCDASTIPSLAEIDPAAAYLSWTIDLETEYNLADVRDVFEFVEDDCDLKVDALQSSGNAKVAEVEEPEVEVEAEETTPPVVELASQSGGDVTLGKPVPESEPPPTPPQAKAPVPPKPVKDAVANDKPAAPTAAKPSGATVRVDLDRVDRLINLVGELVINQAMLSQSVMESGMVNSTPISAGLEEFKHLTREVQESVLAIRAQPIKPLFQRMSRIIREAGATINKAANIVVEGEMTEVDKTVIERLADPLTHMVRNAIDHGLESPADREASGKDSTGTIRLSAEHRSGRVLIEVSDDGGGINRPRVLQIAIDKGLIPANSDLTDAEIDNLLFLPGFSTAEKVSGLSGRGVGMDVVRQSIVSLGGRINISSEPGVGTVFSISLPLTLAILDGMIVNTGGQTIVVPLSAVLEMIQPDQAEIHKLGRDQILILVRGQFIPVIDVGHELGFSKKLEDFSNSVILLIETSDGVNRALVVDAIHDQRQVVIKGLDENYGEVKGIAAATILGDGRIALILDPDAIVAGASAPPPQNVELVALAG